MGRARADEQAERAGRPMRRSSLILRFTLWHALLTCVVIAAVLGFLYAWTLEAQRRRVDEAVAAEAERLRSSLVGLSVSEMAAVVTRHSGDARGGRAVYVYVLSTRTREIVAGNLPAWPSGLRSEPGTLEFPLAAGGVAPGESPPRARGKLVELPSGQTLLVGRDVTDLEEMRDRILRAFFAALGLTAVLGIAAGYAFSRSVSRRLDAINASSEAILSGDLSRRVAVGARGDELDDLAANLNRMLDRLEDLMRGMREVTDDIAHDMRSPISRLRTRIEVALMGTGDAARYREALEQTVKDADDLLAMFNALLTIALAESGAARDRFTEVDLSAVARATAEVYEPLAEEKGVDLRVDAPRPVLLRGEPHLLSQAVANLLDNAVKYVPAGGTVRVRAWADERAARVEVADDGPGIPEEFRDRAFERFSRLETSRSAPGSGLGLSLVRAVARLHGGRVTLAAGDPGLRATVELPRGVAGDVGAA